MNPESYITSSLHNQSYIIGFTIYTKAIHHATYFYMHVKRSI